MFSLGGVLKCSAGKTVLQGIAERGFPPTTPETSLHGHPALRTPPSLPGDRRSLTTAPRRVLVRQGRPPKLPTDGGLAISFRRKQPVTRLVQIDSARAPRTDPQTPFNPYIPLRKAVRAQSAQESDHTLTACPQEAPPRLKSGEFPPRASDWGHLTRRSPLTRELAHHHTRRLRYPIRHPYPEACSPSRT